MHAISGGILLVLLPVSWLVIRNHPKELGLPPDGRRGETGPTAADAVKETLVSLENGLPDARVLAHRPPAAF